MGPLAGVKVLDLSQVVSGPMATCFLSDQGAEVVKVEPPRGDSVRSLGPAKGDLSSAFVAINRGKRSIMLDLKDVGAAATLRRLVEWADVLVENFRPGVMDRLGFGEAACRAANPRLIYASITGYGPDGPYARLRVYDPLVQGTAGIAANQRDGDGAPTLVQTLIVDKLTALTMAQAITAALYAREQSGEGQRIELSMLDAALMFNWPEGLFNLGFVDEPPAASPAYGRFTRLWDAKDGKVAVATFQDHEFAALAAALGRPELGEDARFATGRARAKHIREWGPLLKALVAEKTVAELVEAFVREGAAGAEVNEPAAVIDDPQVAHNRAVVTVDHGDGVGRVRLPRHPARFSGTPLAEPGRAPHVGEHGDAIRAMLEAAP